MTSVGPHRPVALATLASLVLGLLVPGFARAADKEVTFAHQDMVVPFRALMDSGRP
ncbi:hypothetical protein ACRBEV_17990 [Methylobacterium phyllosphaerae]